MVKILGLMFPWLAKLKTRLQLPFRVHFTAILCTLATEASGGRGRGGEGRVTLASEGSLHVQAGAGVPQDEVFSRCLVAMSHRTKTKPRMHPPYRILSQPPARNLFSRWEAQPLEGGAVAE